MSKRKMAVSAFVQPETWGACQLLMLLSLHLEWGVLKQMAEGSWEQLMIWVTATSLGLLLEVGIHLAKDFLR